MSEERIMDRIQKLIDKAMSTEFKPEQDALLQKADALMMQHSIDQMQLEQRAATSPGVKHQAPELRWVAMYAPEETSDVAWEVRSALNSMFMSLASHYHTKIAHHLTSGPVGSVGVVGYPSDLDFLEMMFVQLKLHMVLNLDPKVDVSQPWVVSVYNLKTSGRKWEQIHRMMQAHPGYPRRGEEWSKSCGLTMYGQYKKFVADSPERDYVGTSSPETWRSDFIYGYVRDIQVRLREMRQQTVAENDNLPVLFKDKDAAVTDAFFELFPEQKPHEPGCQCESCQRARKPVRGKGYGGGRVRYRSAAAMSVGGKVAKSADLSPSGSRVGSRKKGELG